MNGTGTTRQIVKRFSALAILLGLAFAARAALHDHHRHALPQLDANGSPATLERGR